MAILRLTLQQTLLPRLRWIFIKHHLHYLRGEAEFQHEERLPGKETNRPVNETAECVYAAVLRDHEEAEGERVEAEVSASEE